MNFTGFVNSVPFIKLMSIIALWLHGIMCMSFSLLLPAMVHPPHIEGQDCPTEYKKMGYHLEWTQLEQGYVTSGYGFGFFVAQLLSEYAVEALGPRWLVLGATLLSGLSTTLLSPAAQLSWIAALVARILTGAGGGVICYSIYDLISRWVPPETKINFHLMKTVNIFVGVVGSWLICGALMEVMNWYNVPFIIGGCAIAWSIVWVLLVHNYPTGDLTAQSDVLQEEEEIPDYVPFRMILTSCPFIALVILFYGDVWGVTLFLMIIPKFIFDMLGFDIFWIALICSVALFCRFGCGLIVELLVRVIQKHDCLDISSLRKIFVFHSHLLTGVSVITLGFIGCNTAWLIVATCFAMFLSGASAVTSQANARDLSPAYVRTLYAVIQVVGLTSTFILPNLLGVFLRDEYDVTGWKSLFLLTGGIYILTGVVFIIFGSGDVQPWNFPNLYMMAHSSKLKRMSRKSKHSHQAHMSSVGSAAMRKETEDRHSNSRPRSLAKYPEAPRVIVTIDSSHPIN